MLLLFQAASGTAATAGIRVGLTAVATASVTFALTVGLSPPTSAELHVSVTPNITIGLNGNNIPTSNGIAALNHSVNLTALPGFAADSTFTHVFGLSGTVGSFFDGEATFTNVLGLAADASPLSDATFDITASLAGLPEVSGGTIDSAATANVVLDLSMLPGFTDSVAADLHININAAGSQIPGINPESILMPPRPRTTLRSFLIGS